jgi:hypothetical protein
VRTTPIAVFVDALVVNIDADFGEVKAISLRVRRSRIGYAGR